MVRSCFGKIKDIKLAAEQCMSVFSRTKRPRHIDRTGVALSRLSRRYKAQWFPQQEVLRMVLKMYQKSGDPKAIGTLIKPYVEDSLPALANAGYIKIDEGNKTLRIRKRAANMMNDIHEEIQDTDFKTALEKYFAHCDAYRQRIGNGSNKTKKELIADLEAIFKANVALRAELAKLLSRLNSRRDLEEHTNAPPQSNDGDIEMDDTPLPGPSTPLPIAAVNATPLPPKMPTNPEAAYRTPKSLQRPQGSFRLSESPPPSPSPLSRQPTLQDQDEFRMDVDEDNVNPNPLQIQVDEPPANEWGFGRYLRNLAGIMSHSAGSRKPLGVNHQVLGQELHQKVIVESGKHLELVTSLKDCQDSLKTASTTIMTQEERLKEKDKEISRLDQNLTTERSLREKAEAQLATMRKNYETALVANDRLQAEVVVIRSRLFHSELGRKAILAKIAKLEKKLHRAKYSHDEVIQSWVARVEDLKKQISADETKAQTLAEDWKRRENELQQEVAKHQHSYQEYQDQYNEMCSVMSRRPHLRPSQPPSI